MGRTASNAPGYALDEEFDPRIDDFTSKDRKYIHFDLPLTEHERKNFKPSRQDILGHAFWPLIGFTAEERRVKKDANGNIEFKIKERPIKFGSHQDAALLDFYGHSLSQDYERYLLDQGLSQSILAYRQGIGSNIDHSKNLFDEIRFKKNCIAVGMDISGFFDHIRHDVLYHEIMKVRQVARLDEIDFFVYRRMTQFEWVESEDLKTRLGKLYGRTGRICYPRDFRRFVRGQKPGKVQKNSNDFGIPQGTPLSGLYANISLLDFDIQMSGLLSSMGGSYRRYSDDLAFVIPNDTNVLDFIDDVSARLKVIGLDVSPAKTEVSQFLLTGEVLEADRPFQYLGFTFDGTRTLIRQSSLNRYYAKMNRGIRGKVRAAKNKNVLASEIFLRQLLRRYTHFGKNQNFPRYAYKAAKVHQAPEIRLQLRSHMRVFEKMVSETIARVY